MSKATQIYTAALKYAADKIRAKIPPTINLNYYNSI